MPRGGGGPVQSTRKQGISVHDPHPPGQLRFAHRALGPRQGQAQKLEVVLHLGAGDPQQSGQFLQSMVPIPGRWNQQVVVKGFSKHGSGGHGVQFLSCVQVREGIATHKSKGLGHAQMGQEVDGMDPEHRLEGSPGFLGAAQPHQGFAMAKLGFHPVRFDLDPPFGHRSHFFGHALGAEEPGQIGQGGDILWGQEKQPVQDLGGPQTLAFLIQAVGPIPQHLHLAGHGMVGGRSGRFGWVENLSAHPEIAQRIAPVGTTQFFFDGMDDGLETMFPQGRQRHLNVGTEFPAERIEGVAWSPQVQPQSNQLQTGFRPRLEGHPQSELPRIGVEIVQDQETQVGPHEAEINKVLDPKEVDRPRTRVDHAVFDELGDAMRKSILFVSAMAILPATAGEVGLLLDKQVGKAQAATGFSTQKYDAVSPTGLGIRGGFDILDLKVAALQLNATWHNKTTGDLSYGGTKYGELENQYVAAGAMVNWKLLVNVGAGVEYRSEKMTFRPNTGASTDTTVGRPWARVNVGFSIPTPVVSPFFLFEVAAPLSKKDSTTTAKDLTEALAPQVQIGIYGGIRF